MKVALTILVAATCLALATMVVGQETDGVTEAGAQGWYIRLLAKKERERVAAKEKGKGKSANMGNKHA